MGKIFKTLLKPILVSNQWLDSLNKKWHNIVWLSLVFIPNIVLSVLGYSRYGMMFVCLLTLWRITGYMVIAHRKHRREMERITRIYDDHVHDIYRRHQHRVDDINDLIDDIILELDKEPIQPRKKIKKHKL